MCLTFIKLLLKKQINWRLIHWRTGVKDRRTFSHFVLLSRLMPSQVGKEIPTVVFWNITERNCRITGAKKKMQTTYKMLIWFFPFFSCQMATWHFMDSGTAQITVRIIILHGGWLWRLAAVVIIPYTISTFLFLLETKIFFGRTWVQAVRKPFQIVSKNIEGKENALLGSFASVHKSWNCIPWCFLCCLMAYIL